MRTRNAPSALHGQLAVHRRCSRPFIVMCLVPLLFTAGCDGDKPVPGSYVPTSPSTRYVPTTSPTPVAVKDEGCTYLHPYRVPVTTGTSYVLPYLNDFVVCTNGAQTSTSVQNKGDLVWTITTASTVSPGASSLRAGMFSVLANWGTRPLLLPQSDVSVNTGPSDVSWQMEAPLNAAWFVFGKFADETMSLGKDKADEIFSGSSPRRKAFATCARAGYSAWQTVEGLSGSDAGQQLLAGAGMYSDGSDCARAWQESDAAAVEQWGRERTPTWHENLTPLWAREEPLVAEATEHIGIWKRAFNAGRLLLRARA